MFFRYIGRDGQQGDHQDEAYHSNKSLPRKAPSWRGERHKEIGPERLVSWRIPHHKKEPAGSDKKNNTVTTIMQSKTAIITRSNSGTARILPKR